MAATKLARPPPCSRDLPCVAYVGTTVTYPSRRLCREHGFPDRRLHHDLFLLAGVEKDSLFYVSHMTMHTRPAGL